jgi:hypothetical protein
MVVLECLLEWRDVDFGLSGVYRADPVATAIAPWLMDDE